jgi:mRNA-degrading endonuclease RelE of RelBE toxin-antitoxin system
VKRLLDEPRSYGYEKLSGKTNLYGVRLSEYRIICSINDSTHLIDVVKTGLGRDAYR